MAGGFQMGTVARDEADPGAFTEKAARTGETNTFAAAADQYVFAIKLKIHDVVPSC